MQRHSPVVLLIGLMALLAVACGSRQRSADPQSPATVTPTPVALVTYVNPAYPYQIGHPRGWTPVTANPDAIVFRGPAGREISVTVQPVPQSPPPPPLSLPAFADLQVESARRSMPNLVELQRVRISLPNKQSGVEVDLTWGDPPAPHRALYLYVLEAGVAFVLRAEAPSDVFSSERRVLDSALRSFTLTAPD